MCQHFTSPLSLSPMFLFKLPRAPRPLLSTFSAFFHVTARVVSACHPTAAGRVDTDIALPFLSPVSDTCNSSTSSMDSTPSMIIEHEQKPRIAGLRCLEADEQNLANIRELRDDVLQIRAYFKSIGTSLQTFDQKGFISYTYFLGQVVQGRILALEPRWKEMSNVRPPYCRR
jgi:hypothetical protein